MDFAFDERTERLRAELLAFMDEHVHPAEPEFERTDPGRPFSWERPKIMAIACHPYLSGVPHRFGYVQRTFADLLARDGVVAWDGARILDWYKAQG